MRGSQDSLDQYQAYLKKSKAFKIPGRKTQVSEPKYASMKIINRHQWIDALHLASEVPGFYTRYLATVKEDLGIAVTFSVSRVHYASYQSVFDRMVSTLRVFRQRKSASKGTLNLKKRSEDLLGDDVYIPDSSNKFGIGVQKKKKGKKKGGDEDLLFVILGVLALAGGGYYYMKKKKATGGKKKRKRRRKEEEKSKCRLIERNFLKILLRTYLLLFLPRKI